MAKTSTETLALTRVGDKLALVLDAAVLARLGITADTPVRVTESGGTLIVTPINRQGRAAMLEVALRTMRAPYEKRLRRLAESAMDPMFLTLGEVLRIQEQEIAVPGGGPGVLNRGLLESTVPTRGGVRRSACPCRPTPQTIGPAAERHPSSGAQLKASPTLLFSPEDNQAKAAGCPAASTTAHPRVGRISRSCTKPSVGTCWPAACQRRPMIHGFGGCRGCS